MRGGIVTVLLRGRRLPLLPRAPLRAKLVAHPPPRCECPPQRPSSPAQHCSPRPRVQRNRARDARPRDDECVTAPRAKHMAEAARLEEREHLRGGRSSRLCACALLRSCADYVGFGSHRVGGDLLAHAHSVRVCRDLRARQCHAAGRVGVGFGSKFVRRGGESRRMQLLDHPAQQARLQQTTRDGKHATGDR